MCRPYRRYKSNGNRNVLQPEVVAFGNNPRNGSVQPLPTLMRRTELPKAGKWPRNAHLWQRELPASGRKVLEHQSSPVLTSLRNALVTKLFPQDKGIV